MYLRLCKPLKSNSFFLFGPRGVGKSYLLKEYFKGDKVLVLDLLNDKLAREFLINPELLIQKTSHLKAKSWVVIDEVQKVPALLDLVHYLIEEKKINFALTGSSSRKLKRGGANLLAGRAFLNNLHPLTHIELKNDFDLNNVLSWGSLPFLSELSSKDQKMSYLDTYVNTYLKEEIKEEQIVRKVDSFIRFLEVASQCNGKILNYSKIGRDAGVDQKAVERYFEILVDTHLGFFLEPFHESIRKRQVQHSKFYFFDLGVKRALENSLDLTLKAKTYAYGDAFEHFILMEMIRLRDYTRSRDRFYYFKTKDDLEIDIVVERPGKKKLLIEIKSTDRVDENEILKLRKIQKDFGDPELWVISQERHERSIEKIKILPWKIALNKMYPIITSK